MEEHIQHHTRAAVSTAIRNPQPALPLPSPLHSATSSHALSCHTFMLRTSSSTFSHLIIFFNPNLTLNPVLRISLCISRYDSFCFGPNSSSSITINSYPLILPAHQGPSLVLRLLLLQLLPPPTPAFWIVLTIPIVKLTTINVDLPSYTCSCIFVAIIAPEGVSVEIPSINSAC